MYVHEPCYDLDELFRENLHVHTSPESRCAKKEMLFADVTACAKRFGLKRLAITNHIQPGEEAKAAAQYAELKKAAENVDGIELYIGAELSAYGVGKFSFRDSDSPLDINLYAPNHYHLDDWEQPEDRSAEGYRRHCTEVLKTLLVSGKADVVAHPFTDRYIVREFGEEYGFTFGCITNLWTDNELGDLLTLGREHGAAWELNTKALREYPDFARRYYHIGREAGVCFTVGSDAHTLADIDVRSRKDEIRKILDA